MRNCIIVHGCPETRETLVDVGEETYFRHWIPWAKKQLEIAGVKTYVPKMPVPWKPVYAKYKAKFEKDFGALINSDTVLIGHSCGCAFLVRWLGDSNCNICKLILVAPWKIPPPNNTIKEKFYGFEINKNVRENVRQIIYFTSDNEAKPGKDSLEMYYSVLGGQIIELHNKGHYTFEDMKNVEFPELVKTVL